MRRQFTMPKKISATVLFTCLLFGLVSWLLLFAQTDQLAKQAIDDKGFSSLAQLHEAILTPLLSNDTISQQVSLQRATEDERVISASLMDIEGQLIAQSASSLLKTTKTKTFKQAIEFQNTQAGIISVEVNSQPIMAQYHRVFINWLLLWLAFTVLCTYGCYRFVDQITARIERLSERLPGKTEPLADEISALETKIQPLLSTSGDSSLAPNNKYFYSLVSGNIKNNQRLLAQLNRDNLDQLLEKLDYCILRTLQLYGGERIEGTEDSFCFAIR
ncbi:YtjB family periplasmic protein, partial [Porticoccaceae bacterium]|nr:YtjB family periplasmic protein [Porticoccaceae bacterium]